MLDKGFNPLIPGDRSLSAREINELAQRQERAAKLTTPEGGQGQIDDEPFGTSIEQVDLTLKIRITGGSNPYSWEEVMEFPGPNVPIGSAQSWLATASPGTNVKAGYPLWSAVTTYHPGDLVMDGGTGYKCILGNINFEPPNSTYWVIAPTALVMGAYDENANPSIPPGTIVPAYINTVLSQVFFNYQGPIPAWVQRLASAGAGWLATSTAGMTIATGTVEFTFDPTTFIQLSTGFYVVPSTLTNLGDPVIIDGGGGNTMIGTLFSFTDAGVMTVAVSAITGSGTFASWSIKGAAWDTTSTTTQTIAASGSMTLAVDANLQILPNDMVRISDHADSSKFMTGIVTAYSGTSLVATILGAVGIGTMSSAWDITVALVQGVFPGAAYDNKFSSADAPGEKGTPIWLTTAIDPTPQFFAPGVTDWVVENIQQLKPYEGLRAADFNGRPVYKVDSSDDSDVIGDILNPDGSFSLPATPGLVYTCIGTGIDGTVIIGFPNGQVFIPGTSNYALAKNGGAYFAVRTIWKDGFSVYEAGDLPICSPANTGVMPQGYFSFNATFGLTVLPTVGFSSNVYFGNPFYLGYDLHNSPEVASNYTTSVLNTLHPGLGITPAPAGVNSFQITTCIHLDIANNVDGWGQLATEMFVTAKKTVVVIRGGVAGAAWITNYAVTKRDAAGVETVFDGVWSTYGGMTFSGGLRTDGGGDTYDADVIEALQDAGGLPAGTY